MRTRSIVLGKSITLPPSRGDNIVDVYDDTLVLSRTGGVVRITPYNDDTPMIEAVNDAVILDAYVWIDGGRLPLTTSTTSYRIAISRPVVRYRFMLRYRASSSATVLIRLRFEYPYRTRSFAHVTQRKIEIEEERASATKTLPPGGSRICSKI